MVVGTTMRLRVSTLFIGVLMAFVLLLTEQGYLKSYLALTSERGALDEPGKRRKPKKTFSVENVLKNSRLEKQVLYIVRHGDRWDYYAQKKLNISEGSELWPKDAVKADPVLSDLGFQQSREAGVFLNTLLASDGITSADQITLVTSPFIRCVQSANEVIDSLINVNGTIDIFLEIGMANAIRSNFDYDAAVERLSTQQRVNTTIQNRLGVPKESNEYHNRHEFKARVTEVVNSLNQAFPYEPGTAILAVTHGSVAPLLVKDAGHYRLKEDHFKRVRPGCISKLSRMSNKQVWDVELLLYDEHISEMGVTQR